MARNTSVNVGVNFVPNTSQLDSALKQFNNVDLQTRVTGISGDVLAPFRQSVEDLNAAMASGRGENEITQLMDRVKTEANAARASLDAATAGIKAFYDSPVNQKNLDAISEIDAKLESATNQLKQWNKNKSALNNLRQLASQSGFDINTTARGRMKQIKDIEALRDAQGNLNEEFQTQIDLIRQYQTISNELRTTRKGDIESNIRNLTLSRENLLANTVTPEMFADFTTSAAMTSSQVTSQENDFLNRLPAYTQNLQKMAKASDEATDKVKKLGDTFTASFLGFSLSNLLEDAVRGAQEFFTAYDDTLTRTQMVTGMTRDEVMNLTSAYAELADELSSTISAVAEAQLVFYQQGLSTEDSLAMTEASIAISKTGGIEAGEAADRLTAAVNGYQLAASDAMDIADKMSALDAAAASSVDELTVAMQKSASQARMAGLDLDYYMAYLSTMQEVTREAPENIGTAMKSITSRIQEITDIGKVEEDGTTFSNVAEALNSIGIAALDTQGQLRPLQEILNELGPMWATLDRNHQAYIATVLAGNRQQSRFIALMDNYDRALQLVDISQNSAGESSRQLRAYDEGLESSLIGLQNAWQQFATSLVDSDMIKTVVDGLTSLIEVINSIPDGLLQAVAGFIGLSAAMKTINAIKGPDFKKWFGQTGMGRFISVFKTALQSSKETSTAVQEQWRGAIDRIADYFGKLAVKIKSSFSQIKGSSDMSAQAASINNVNGALDANTTKLQTNTAAKAQNSAQNSAEIGSNAGLVSSVSGVTDGYNQSAAAIDKQAQAMNNNDTTIETEIEQQEELVRIKSLEAKSQSLQKDIADINSSLEKNREQRNVYVDRFNSTRQTYREAYENAVLPENLEAQARTNLRLRGYASGEQLSLFGDSAEISEKQKAYQVALNEEIKKVKDELGNWYHEAVEELRDQLEKDLEPIMKSNKRLGISKGKKRSQLSKIISEIDETSQKIVEERVGDISQTVASTGTGKQKTGLFSKIKTGLYNSAGSGDLKAFSAAGDYSGASLKGLFSNQNLGIIQKFQGALSGINLAGGLMSKTLVQAGTSMLGFSDDTSEGLSNTVSLGVAFGKFAPPYGAIIGASIGVISWAFDALTVSAEEARQSLEEINAEQDELAQRSTNISGALESYTELSNNLARTEDEQQQLNDAAAQLADLIPSAVRGYDNLGNAIIDVTRAQAELNSIAEDNVRLAKEEMESIADLQEAEDGWDFTRDLLEIFTPGGKSADEKQLEDRLAVAEEYRADITDYFTTLRDSISSEMNETEAQLFNNVASAFQKQLTDRIFSTDLDNNLEVNEAAAQYEQLLASFTDKVSISELQSTIDELKYTFEFGNQSFKEASDTVRSEITGMLSRAGYDAEEIEQIVNVVVDITMDGGGQITSALNAIEEERRKILAIDEEDRTIQDKERLKDLAYMDEQYRSLNAEAAEFAASLGLLNVESADFIRSQGGINNIIDGFRDANGEIESTTADLDKLNEAYKKTEELEERKKELQEAMTSGELTWSGGKNAKDFVKSERDGWAWLGISDATYADLLEDAISAYGGQSVTDEQLKEIFSQNHYNPELITDEEIQTLKDLYDKFIATSDQGEELSSTNGELDMMLNYLEKIEKAYPEEPSFGDMKETLDGAISSAQTLYELLNDIDEQNNELSAQNISTIFGILDELENSFNNGIIDSDIWSSNMQALANNLKVVNGEMTLTKEGQQALVNLQIESIRATYRSQLADLEATEAKLLNQKAIMTAYLSSLQATLNGIKTEGENKFKESNAEKEMAKTLGDYLDAQNWAQVESTQASLNEMLEGYQSFFTQIDKMYTQMRNGEEITFKDIRLEQSDVYDKILSPMEDRYKGLITDTYGQTVSNLEGEIEAVKDTINAIDAELAGVQAKKKVAEYILSDDIDFGSFLGGADEAAEELDEYNEQLERTLTLLEKIEGIQHKIDENDAFRDLYEGTNGTRRGELLAENLRLYEEQFDYYKQLFDMQQEMTNQAAGDLLDSPYGELFTIAENGDIGWATTEMYDKYKGLPGDMQEDIDNLVQAFQDQRDALRDTENELLNYADAMKEAREEIIDLIEETEDLILETIKDREEVLHNARIKALEDEIEMIEEAVEARNDAREEQDNAEDLFEAQEALRRATLDSSGKNNATLLQLQQDLEDKQQEISEKRFEDDMDARKEYLQAIIDAENETYDYRLETMTWYWEQVELMQEQSTEVIMKFLMTWNEEYLKESQFGQERLMEQWQTTFDELNALMQDEMTDNINDLKSKFLDLASGVEAIDVNVQALAGTWDKVTQSANNAANAMKNASSYKGTTGGGKDNTKDTSDDDLNGKVSSIFDDMDSKESWVSVRSAEGYSVGATVAVEKNAPTYDLWGKKTGSLYGGLNGAIEEIITNGDDYWVRLKGDKKRFFSIDDITSTYVSSISTQTPTYRPMNAPALRYARGGLVDYTGPAWVDGSTTNPEAFLSSYQTEQIGALAKALDSSSVSTVSNSSNVTFGTITFNVASMSSAADGRKALDTFVKGANEMMAKKGVNTTLNLNYK